MTLVRRRTSPSERLLDSCLREGQASGLWLAGAALATLAVVGALLTLGLVQRWGEDLPGWLPIIGAGVCRPR